MFDQWIKDVKVLELYRKNYSRSEAENELGQFEMGNFLLRESRGKLVLSFSVGRGTAIQHQVICRNESMGGGFHTEGSKTMYSSIKELLSLKGFVWRDGEQVKLDVSMCDEKTIQFEPFFVNENVSASSLSWLTGFGDGAFRIQKSQNSFIVHFSQNHQLSSAPLHCERRGGSAIRWSMGPNDWSMGPNEFANLHFLLSVLKFRYVEKPLPLLNSLNVPKERQADPWFFPASFLEEPGWHVKSFERFLLPSYKYHLLNDQGRVLHAEQWEELRMKINQLDAQGVGLSACVSKALAVNNERIRCEFYAFYNENRTKEEPRAAFERWAAAREGVMESAERLQWRRDVGDALAEKNQSWRAKIGIFDQNKGVSQSLACHGTRTSIAPLIASSGLNKMYRPKQDKDWYGVGTYCTDDIGYAINYSFIGEKQELQSTDVSAEEAKKRAAEENRFTVVIGVVQWTQAFPVIDSPQEKEKSLVYQKKIADGFDLNFALVSPTSVQVEKNNGAIRRTIRYIPQQIVSPPEVMIASEFCFERQSTDRTQFIPMYIVEFNLTNEVVERLRSIKVIDQSKSTSGITAKQKFDSLEQKKRNESKEKQPAKKTPSKAEKLEWQKLKEEQDRMKEEMDLIRKTSMVKK